ncbi:hypothetical protein QG37_01005 [Candidozyma auris]|nr:hypothetical protein QG37_01005 [[Candida] auris]
MENDPYLGLLSRVASWYMAGRSMKIAKRSKSCDRKHGLKAFSAVGTNGFRRASGPHISGSDSFGIIEGKYWRKKRMKKL